jgi:drug/metabolite transporter (DMT)-like permease
VSSEPAAAQLATLLGFVGMLLITQPTLHSFNVAYLVALASTLMAAFISVSMRSLAQTEDPLAIMIYTPIAILLVLAVPVAQDWLTPTVDEWAWLATLTVTGLAMHWASVFASRYATLAFTAPLRYMQLIFAALWGLLFFGDVPSISKVLGAAAIIGAGLWVFYSRRQQSAPT